MNNNNKKLGVKLLYNIETNSYLQKLYHHLLIAYSCFLFQNKQNELKKKEYMDLARFADLLSNSQDLEKSEFHRNLAHKIIAMLITIYPKSHIMLFYKNRILSNLNNYYQLQKDKKLNPQINTDSIVDFLVNDYKKKKLRIPSSTKTFIGKQKILYKQLDTDLSSVSAPTSMGKTFLIIQFIISKMQNTKENKSFALVVPSRALITEITEKLISELSVSTISCSYRIINSTESTVNVNTDDNLIFIVTPERLFYLLSNNPKIRLNYLFVDESQKISEQSPRSAFYYQIFDMIDSWNVKPKVTFVAPAVPNPEEYLKVFQTKHSGKYLSINESVVSQVIFLTDTPNRKTWIFNDLTNKLIDLPFINVQSNTQVGVLRYFTKKFKSNIKNIVYPNSIKRTINLSNCYANDLNEINNNSLKKLSEYIDDKISPEYYLGQLTRKGLAFHIGRLPANVRRKIENEYKEGAIQTIFCTSTLMEGVNLPADNIFVFDLKNGRRGMSDVDFNNLIGRAGRLNHSMIGNAFLITNSERNKKPQIGDYLKLLKRPINNQKLSIDKFLSKNKLDQINSDLQKGNIDLKHVKSKSISEYTALRKFTLIYLNDIDKDRESIVRTRFSKAISKKDERKINETIKSKYNSGIENDINFSSDQSDNLTTIIKSEGFTYPEPILDGKLNVKGTLDLLKKMADIYKWKIYEKSDLGKINEANNELINLPDYTYLLLYWISGANISKIILECLKLKEKDKYFLERDYSNWDGSLSSKNNFINLILDKINQILNFKLKNYFMKMTKEICRLNHVESIENDWYRFTEYGTTSALRIWLQQHGYSRESTKYIEDNKSLYISEDRDGYLLSSKLENSDDDDVSQETKQIKLFMPNIFIE